jgi:hypothetical protein
MMASKALRVLVPGVLLPVFLTHAGGWAVVTLDDLPESVEVGKAVSLTYMVRQHGVEPHDGLRGIVEATSGRLTARGVVTPGDRKGQYTARITLPTAGDWSIRIESGFPKADVTLLPIPALTAGETMTRPASDADRGGRLFVAKGCVTCHVQIPVGPKLEGKRFDPTYLAGFLANPPATPRVPATGPMPNLGLDQREIASLVAYLNNNREMGAR